MSSAKAALESDTKVSHFVVYILVFQIDHISQLQVVFLINHSINLLMLKNKSHPSHYCYCFRFWLSKLEGNTKSE